jgi:hypothetical protein
MEKKKEEQVWTITKAEILAAAERMKQAKPRGMYETPRFSRTTLSINQSTVGETIERRVERAVHNKEPIEDSAPLVYQARADGVNPAFNIRTDRFEIAIEASDKIAKSFAARREEAQGKPEKKVGGAEPVQGSEEPPVNQ